MSHVGWILRYFCAVIYFIVLIKNGRIMGQRMIGMVSKLAIDQRKSLRRYAITVSIVTIVIRILEVGVTINHLYVVRAVMIHAIADVVTEIKQCMINWLILGAFIHCFVVRIILMTERNYFLRLKVMLDNKFTDEELAKERAILSNDRQELMTLFSLIPVTWFAHIFIELSASVMEAFDSSITSPLRFVQLVSITCQTLVIFYIIFTCEQVNTCVKDNVSSVILWITSQHRSSEYHLLVHELKECSRQQFTAWSMFEIHRTFVLSFISSLITFTVLFTQTANTVVKT